MFASWGLGKHQCVNLLYYRQNHTKKNLKFALPIENVKNVTDPSPLTLHLKIGFRRTTFDNQIFRQKSPLQNIANEK